MNEAVMWSCVEVSVFERLAGFFGLLTRVSRNPQQAAAEPPCSNVRI